MSKFNFSAPARTSSKLHLNLHLYHLLLTSTKMILMSLNLQIPLVRPPLLTSLPLPLLLKLLPLIKVSSLPNTMPKTSLVVLTTATAMPTLPNLNKEMPTEM